MDRETFDRKYTGRLNRQQAEAVHAAEGAVLLLAVPGSGKTTVLVTRLGYMLCSCGIPADKILTMTYTKAATREMKQRFARLFGEDCPDIPEFRTINGVSSKIIDFYAKTHSGGNAFRLMEDEGLLSKLVSDLYRALSGEFATQGVIKELRKNITYVKNSMLDKEEIDDLDTGFEKFPELYRRYNLALRKQHWMDYDDQMVYAKTILEKHADVLTHFQDMFPYICVDESQDTSKIQHSIIQLLAQKSGNIFMVGDEDQSIYGFRAAYPEALMRFGQTYPNARVLLMEENYRSTPEILRLADDFIRKNHGRHPKTIHPTRDSGADVRLITAADRAAQYAWLAHTAARCDGQMAVLYRNNDSALPLIDLLPQILRDTARKGLDRIWRELRYRDYVDQQKLDTNKFEILCLLAGQEPGLDALLERLDRLRSLTADPPVPPEAAVLLSTVHSSKGLEYDTVYLLDVLDGILPAVTEPKSQAEQVRYQEERRLFYVAMTRARNHLYLFSCLDRSSAFIREVKPDIPVETPDDVFAAFPAELCGKRYHHAQKGRGNILADCDGQCLIAYDGGQTQFLTVGQMYEQRKIVRKLPEKPAAAKKQAAAPGSRKSGGTPPRPKVTLSREEKAALIRRAVPGCKVVHRTFGAGVVVGCQEPIVTIRFWKFGEKKFVLPDSAERGLLHFD